MFSLAAILLSRLADMLCPVCLLSWVFITQFALASRCPVPALDVVLCHCIILSCTLVLTNQRFSTVYTSDTQDPARPAETRL